jgi:hypothetical protein
MGKDLFQKLADKYPFITLCVYASNEYVGIVQNRDDVITTIYDFVTVKDLEQKRRYLDLANTWWWESNRSIPINIFLRGEWDEFRLCLRTFVNKDLEILHGPVFSLNDISRRKGKRISITLVRRLD